MSTEFPVERFQLNQKIQTLRGKNRNFTGKKLNSNWLLLVSKTSKQLQKFLTSLVNHYKLRRFVKTIGKVRNFVRTSQCNFGNLKGVFYSLRFGVFVNTDSLQAVSDDLKGVLMSCVLILAVLRARSFYT